MPINGDNRNGTASEPEPGIRFTDGPDTGYVGNDRCRLRRSGEIGQISRKAARLLVQRTLNAARWSGRPQSGVPHCEVPRRDSHHQTVSIRDSLENSRCGFPGEGHPA